MKLRKDRPGDDCKQQKRKQETLRPYFAGSWLLSLSRAPTKSVQPVHVAWAGRRPQDL